MIKRVLTIFATVALGATAMSVANAQTYAPAPGYPPGGYPAETRASAPGQMPDFDSTDEDDDAPRGRQPGVLPTPGPVMSPDDPRYGRSAGAPPVYSNAGPQGPVMSPDDPRYGRSAGAPPAYSNNAPQGPVMSPDDPRYGRPMGPPPVVYSDRGDGMGQRPPEAVGAPVTGSVQPQDQGQGAGGSSVMVAALPAEDQPEGGNQGESVLAPNLRRQEVNFVTKEPPGTIVVDTPNTYLYFVLGNNRAIRYGVRVGRDGFTWNGVQKITRKAEWPDWHPPTEMIERQPYLPRFMAGGPGNPLGARAMYLGSTVYRIHGTNQPSSIGKFMSSGCIGMLNEDVSDLFERAKVGTRVVVMPAKAPTMASAGPVPGPNYAPLPGTQPSSVQPLPAPVTVR